MNKNKVQCSGVKLDSGERCTLRTDDSSGYCHKHREQLNKETEYALMKCDSCPIKGCAYAFKAPGNICFFEIADNVKDFDEQWKVYQGMKDTLKFNRLLLGRLEREISSRNMSDLGAKGDTTNLLLKNYNMLISINGTQMVLFGKFMGWASEKSEDSKVEDRKKSLKIVFAREKEKDKEDEKVKESIEALEKEAEEIAQK